MSFDNVVGLHSKEKHSPNMEENSGCRVCVTGGSGYIASWLIKRLLEKGCIVNATLRNLGDTSKVDLLKSLPNAEDRLVLFQADIYNPIEFGPAITGCEYVFHVATPLQHNTQSSEYKDTTEAAVAAVRTIADICIRSQTVKRLIYTASMVSSSPLTEDGAGLKSSFDESCVTPLGVSFTNGTDQTQVIPDGILKSPFLSMLEKGYTKSKTLAEKEVLKYNECDNGKLEVVTLPCGLVGGETLLPYIPTSVGMFLSLFTGNLPLFTSLKLLQELWGSIFLLHIEDVCRAHIFCMERPSMRGRFLCAATSLTIREIAIYFGEKFPEYKILKESLEVPEEAIKCDLTKLTKLGFDYLYDEHKVLEDSVECGRRLEALV